MIKYCFYFHSVCFNNKKIIIFFIIVFFIITNCRPEIAMANDIVKIPDMPAIPSMPLTPSSGNTYYVNKDIGNDSYSKTKAQDQSTPWKTIKNSISKIMAGDTIVIENASTSYDEYLYIDVSGTSSNWINITGNEDDRPTLKRIDVSGKCFFIKIKNINFSSDSVGIKMNPGVQNIVIENVDIDGKNIANYGLQLGIDQDDETGVKHGYINNVEVHNTVRYGVYIENGVEDIVFNSVVSRDSVGNDGFAGRGNPSESNGPVNDLYFVNCVAHNNAGDGFDIGAGHNEVFLNCKSYNNGGYQGTGFKLWGGIDNGGSIWLVNCLAFNNAAPAVALKNIADVDCYILHNTFIKNETAGGGVEIMIVDYNDSGSGGFYMGVPSLHIYNNIIYSEGESPFFSIYNDNALPIGVDNNYYVSSSDKKFIVVRNSAKEGISSFMLSDLEEKKDILWAIGKNPVPLYSENKSVFNYNKTLNECCFVDEKNNDFSLKDCSPAIGKGCVVGIKTDINGNIRSSDYPDIGAFEYAKLKPIPPQNLEIINE